MPRPRLTHAKIAAFSPDLTFYGRLHVLHVFAGADRWNVDGRINRRARIAAALERGTLPDGTARVEECGRDCDGMEYGGRVHVIEPTVRAYDELAEQIGEWADGPFSLHVVPADEADPPRYSHDTFAEAAGY